MLEALAALVDAEVERAEVERVPVVEARVVLVDTEVVAACRDVTIRAFTDRLESYIGRG